MISIYLVQIFMQSHGTENLFPRNQYDFFLKPIQISEINTVVSSSIIEFVSTMYVIDKTHIERKKKKS